MLPATINLANTLNPRPQSGRRASTSNGGLAAPIQNFNSLQQRTLSLHTANIKVIQTASGTMKITRNNNDNSGGINPGANLGMYNTI